MQKKIPFWLKIILIIPTFVIFVGSLSFTILNYPAARARPVVKVHQLSNDDIARVVSTSVIQNNLSKDNANQILESTVRIKRGDGAGTGVIIASHKHPARDVYYTYIITNRHNIGSADEATVEVFNYLERREISSVTSYTGKILQRSRNPDLALVEVRSEQPFGRVAQFITLARLEKLELYDSVFVCGCSLGRPPMITNGNLAHVTKDNYTITAFAIFGNSGGGLFDIDGKLLGVVTRIAGVPIPNGDDSIVVPVSNMPYVIPSPVVASWLSDSDYSFIVGEGSFDQFITAQDLAKAHQFHRE